MSRKKRKKTKKMHSSTRFILDSFKALFRFVWFLLKVIAKGIFFLFKYLFLGIVWIFKKSFHAFQKDDVKKSKDDIVIAKDDKKSDSRPLKSKAIFSPFQSKKIVKGSFVEFENRLFNQSLIITIVGRRGCGKSALGFRILENVFSKTKRPCFALGVKQNVLPSWIKSISSVDSADDSGVILVDEGAVEFSSRKSMSKSNRQLADLLAIARHKDLTLVLITQNTGMIDKNVLNLTDMVIVKEGSLLQQKMERSVMKDLYDTAMKNFSKLQPSQRNAYFYVFDSVFEAFCSADLPSFWSENVSKSRSSGKKKI